MKILIPFTLALLAALFVAGCQENPVQAPVQSAGSIDAAAALRMIQAEIDEFDSGTDQLDGVGNHGHKWGNRNFIGILSGGQEVPVRDSHGRGVAKFKVAKDGNSISYKLIVANISNVVAAHIHRGGVGQTGPAVLGLYSAPPGGGKINGPIAQGSFTAADLSGPYTGSVDFGLFMADLHSDSLYVNVHTDDGVDSTVGGAGDFPNGEIRGQLRGHANKGKDDLHEEKKAGNDRNGRGRDDD